jgi:tetratricopeptide (TPR) repeat protein
MFENLSLLKLAMRQVFNRRFIEEVRAEYFRLKEGQENPKLQVVYLKRLAQLEDKDPTFPIRLAEVLLEQGDKVGALQYRRDALRLLMKTDQLGPAFQAATKALQLDPGHIDTLKAYVHVAERSDSLESAAKFLRALLDKSKKKYPLQLALAWVREKQGEIQTAFQLYKELDILGVTDNQVKEGLNRTGISIKEGSDMEQELAMAMDTLFTGSQ